MKRWVALLAIVLCAGSARANTVVQGMATVSGGYNTNPLGQPFGRPDWFADIRPGLRLTSLFDRGLFYAQYTFDATMYLHRSAASGYSNDFSVGTLLISSRTTSVTLSAGVLQSNVNNIQALQTSVSAPAVIIPAGTAQFVAAHAGAGVNWDVTQAWRLSENSTFTAFVPITEGLRQTYDINNVVVGGRSWRRDSLDLQLRVDYINFPDATINGVDAPGSDQLLQAVSARWLHDFGSFFSTELMGGVLLAMRASDGGGRLWRPVARAALHYRREEGSADLAYEHAVEASIFSGATYDNDTVSLHIGIPLGRTSGVALAASGAYMRSNVYNALLGTLAGSSDVWLADATLSWSPWQEMSFFARYSFTDQIGNPTDPTPIPTFMRHLVVAGVTIIYPAVAAAPVGLRSSVRADRSDAVEVPALHSPQPEAPPPQSQRR
jgi:hypothetical protein